MFPAQIWCNIDISGTEKIVQFFIAYSILPLTLPAYLKLGLMLLGTFGISLLLYEYALRRLKWVRPLFGMKLTQ